MWARAFLIHCTRDRRQVAVNTRAMAALTPVWTLLITSPTPPRPRARMSAGTRSRCLGFRRADAKSADFPATLGVFDHFDDRSHRHDPPAFAYLEISDDESDVGLFLCQRACRTSPTRSSISIYSFDTVPFDIPFSPIACTSSSTRRVEAPPIQNSPGKQRPTLVPKSSVPRRSPGNSCPAAASGHAGSASPGGYQECAFYNRCTWWCVRHCVRAGRR